MTQALVHGKRVRREPEPPYIANVNRFLVVHHFSLIFTDLFLLASNIQGNGFKHKFL
jgi:hypothetical protein